MDLEYLLFSALLHADAPDMMEIRREWLSETGKRMYDWIFQFVKSYGKLPEKFTIEQHFKVRLPETKETVLFYANEIAERTARGEIAQRVREEILAPVSLIHTAKTSDSVDRMMHLGAELQSKYRKKGAVETIKLSTDYEQLKSDYGKRKQQKGLLGVPFPFEPMNVCTSGAIGGELTAIMARSGIGKTWFLTVMAAHLIEQGFRVAFVSQEMYAKRLSNRLVSILAKVNPYNHRNGKLSADEEQRLLSFYQKVRAKQIKGDVTLFSPGTITKDVGLELFLSLHRNNFDILLWDSPYLAVRGKDHEQKAEFVSQLKGSATSFNIPIVVAWQFNRTVTSKDSSGDQTSAAFTDAIVTDADYNFGIYQDAENASLHQVNIRSLKSRDGYILESMLVKWDIPNAHFEVLSYEIPGYGSSHGNYAVNVASD